MDKRELWNKCAEIDGLQEFITELKGAGFSFDYPPVRFEDDGGVRISPAEPFKFNKKRGRK